MSLFGKLLGSDKALDIAKEGVKGSIELVDDAFFTDEERIVAKHNAMRNWIELQRIIGQESSPTSLSRRVIAWAVIGPCVFTFLIGVLCILVGREDVLIPLSQWVIAMNMGWAFVTVIAFYFGAHIVKAAMGGKEKE